MPISIIVGGQFGSEGKGKVALHLARQHGAKALLVRVGGSNSGHTAYDSKGFRYALRQLPVGAIDGNPMAIAAGSYVDADVLLREIEQLNITPDRLAIDPQAKLITDAHKRWEKGSRLKEGIGSTASGTGASVIAAAGRGTPSLDLTSPRVCEDTRLKPFLGSTADLIDRKLINGERVIVEGTQGYGLSVLHGEWPYVTSRDTTAAAFLSEIGRGPGDVDDVILVIRSHPIRVAGNSGKLPHETSWGTVGLSCGADRDITERTTVTNNVRRIGGFDAALVRDAIRANSPTRIALNHLDHLDWQVRDGKLNSMVLNEVKRIEAQIGRNIDLLGINERELLDRGETAATLPLLQAVG
jgi:adenylosuccinate synthase